MKSVIQRVSSSKVTVDGSVIGSIGVGLNILLGLMKGDTADDVKTLTNKIANLRIFQDQNNKMNLSLVDINGEALVISQFTLAANVKKGRRPSFDNSEEPSRAKELYEEFVKELFALGIKTQTGEFGAMMDVEIRNDGPVTIILDTKEL